VSEPDRIPVQRYYDEEFYKAETEHLWPHVWQMACRLEQISGLGDWVEYQNLGRSVIIVRTDDGVKAFHNACRHRGVPFAGGRGNDHGNCKSSGFVCPFHGWRWTMYGENSFVYGKQLFSERQLNPVDLKLRPCRVETAIGCAFINFDDAAPSLRESIGPLLDRLEAHNIGQLRMEWWLGTHLPANWKIATEAFMEGYHVMKTHPQGYDPILDTYATRSGSGGSASEALKKGFENEVTTRVALDVLFRKMESSSEGMAGMLHAKEVEIARRLLNADLPDSPSEALPMWFGMVADQITRELSARGEPVPNLCAVMQSDPINAVEFLFPHYFLLPFFSSCSSYRVRPTGPESCFFEIWSLTFFPEGAEPEPLMEPTILPYDSQEFPPIPRQDYSNIPIQQKGVHASGFDFMRLSKDVEGLISNYQRLIDGYLAGVASEKLAKATHHLGGNFDGGIENLGF
jgi:phenylpropionate dioxygenase-like ring-hydroxylating dioxygenase large terminal subunit